MYIVQQKESLGKSHVVKNVDGNANAEGTELLYNLTSLAHHGQWDDIVGKTKCLLYTVAGFISALAKETSGVATGESQKQRFLPRWCGQCGSDFLHSKQRSASVYRVLGDRHFSNDGDDYRVVVQ
jgi:hypothetical protein